MKFAYFKLIAAVFAVILFSACKTQRTEKWSTREDPLRKHFAGNFTIQEDEFGNRRSVKTNKDGEVLNDGSAFIGKREFDESTTFKDGKRNMDKKAFNTKLFSGNKDVNKDSYQFLKAREDAKTKSNLQEKQFLSADNEPADSRKKWFFRDKQVKNEGFFAKRKKNAVPTSDYSPATKATEGNRGKQLPIITPPGQSSDPITLKDVKEMLGREY